MAEYIEREKAINEFAIRSSFYDAEWGNKRFTPDDVKEILQSIPAADVRPVVRAHWTDLRTIEHDGEWYCSNCGNEVTICMCGKDKTRDYPYCPNCGADMREEN